MLAVHGTTGTLIGTNESFAKTSLGYSGEAWDASSQTQYLRARSYEPRSGRFIGLDPYRGNNHDPQSLHKYAYVHADPIGMTDPTGMVGLGGISISSALMASMWTMGVSGAVIGGLYGAARSFVDGIVDPESSWRDVAIDTAVGGVVGTVSGFISGAGFALLLAAGPFFAIAGIMGLSAWGVTQNYAAVKQSIQRENPTQAGTRAVFGVIDLFLALVAVRGIHAAKSPNANPPATPTSVPASQSWVWGRQMGATMLEVASFVLGRVGVKVEIVTPGSPVGSNPNGLGGYSWEFKTIYIREDATYVVFLHEFLHAMHHKSLGDAKYSSLTSQQKAQFVLDGTLNLWRGMMNTMEWEYVKWSFYNEAGIAPPVSTPTIP